MAAAAYAKELEVLPTIHAGGSSEIEAASGARAALPRCGGGWGLQWWWPGAAVTMDAWRAGSAAACASAPPSSAAAPPRPAPATPPAASPRPACPAAAHSHRSLLSSDPDPPSQESSLLDTTARPHVR